MPKTTTVAAPPKWPHKIPPSQLDRRNTAQTISHLWKLFLGDLKGEVLPTNQDWYHYRTAAAGVKQTPEKQIQESKEDGTVVSHTFKPRAVKKGANLYLKPWFEIQIKWGPDENFTTHTFMLQGEYERVNSGIEPTLKPRRDRKDLLKFEKGERFCYEGDQAIAMFLDFHPKNKKSPIYWTAEEQKNTFGIRLLPIPGETGTSFSRELVHKDKLTEILTLVEEGAAALAIGEIKDINIYRQLFEKFGLKAPEQSSFNLGAHRSILMRYAMDNPHHISQALFGDVHRILPLVKDCLSKGIITAKDGQIWTHTGKYWDWADYDTESAKDVAFHVARRIIQGCHWQLFQGLQRQLEEAGANNPIAPKEPTEWAAARRKAEHLMDKAKVVLGTNKWETNAGVKLKGWMAKDGKKTTQEKVDILIRYIVENPEELEEKLKQK